jgi:hypothetical protein
MFPKVGVLEVSPPIGTMESPAANEVAVQLNVASNAPAAK